MKRLPAACVTALAMILASAGAEAACGKISQCPDASLPISGAELIPVVQSGVTKKIRADNLFAGTFTVGNQTPTTAGLMKIDNQLQVSTFPMENEGGIFLAQAYAFVGINKEMTADTVPVPGAGPLTALFVLAQDNNSGGDVVAILGDCVVEATGGKCWGSNLIARTNGTGISAELIGLEIDYEPLAGDTVTGGCALCINVFTGPVTPAAIQIGAFGSLGRFGNGIVFDAIALTGAALSSNVGATDMAYFAYTANSNFTSATYQLGNLQTVSWLGTTGTPSKMYLSAADTQRFVSGDGTTAFSFRNNADAADLVTVSSGGNLSVTGNYLAGATPGITSCTVVTAGATITITAGIVTAFTGC
jgi:hypothetical protein